MAGSHTECWNRPERYRTKDEAQAVARRRHGVVAVGPCRRCAWFHLQLRHQPKRDRRRRP